MANDQRRPASSGHKMAVRKGDRIVFLGDSITEQQLYTNYVESYLAARFPELGLTFFNAGWGGDTAPGGAGRLERDVLSLKPTLVTICYGMNDGRYQALTPQVLGEFSGGMDELVVRLKRAGVRIVLMTPGITDARFNPMLATIDYNGANLRRLADYVLKLARRHKLPAVDTHKLMSDVDGRARAADPTFTMIPDGVHPDPAGHLVMAYGLLKALGVPPRRQRIVLDAKRGVARGSDDGVRVHSASRNGSGYELSLGLDRLPFYVEPAARKVLPFLPFQETYNALRLTVRGAAEEAYCFRSPTGRGDVLARRELERGINYFSYWEGEAMAAGARVHRFTYDKTQIYYKLWRGMALNGESGPGYLRPVHRLGSRTMKDLEQGRASLAHLNGRVFTSRLVPAPSDREIIGNGDFISRWSFAGPFPRPFERDSLGGEAAFTARAPQLNGSQWVERELNCAMPGNALAEIYGSATDCSGYALTLIDSPIEQAAELLLGTDDGFAVWLNGRELASNLNLQRGVVVDQDRVALKLRAGTNVLLIKVSQGGGGWGLCARFAGLQAGVVVRRAGKAKGQ